MSCIRNVALGISGGVDSAVAALLLKKKGFNVINVFMKNWDVIDESGTCSVLNDLEDAKYVSNQLKLPFHVVDFVKEYWNEVFVNFINELEMGITPNPDIMCNKHIKFQAFFNYAMNNLKVDAVATGHYARTSFGDYLERYDPQKKVKLLKPKDHIKDQTFFLSQVSQNSLQKTMFPLSNLMKANVKKIAFENGLAKIAQKEESMGICFIGSRQFKKFISNYITPKPGNFININTGQVEGTHDGIHLWTVGQRCRLPGRKEPFFVVQKHPKTAEILIAPGFRHSSLYSSMFITGKPHWIADEPELEYVNEFDFRFQHVEPLSPCVAFSLKAGDLTVILKKPLRALTPGQYAVFYKKDECLGSSKIIGIGPSEFSYGHKIPEDFQEYDEQLCVLDRQ